MTGVFDNPEIPDPQGTGGGLALNPTGGSWTPEQPRVVVKPVPGTTLDSVPAPYGPVSDGELTEKEQKDLEACEAGVDNLRKAFWIAGKSLDTMAQAHLTRKRHRNFADYVWERWEISESQMQRLRDEWKLGEIIAKKGYRPKESQVRALTKFAKFHGEPAAAAVYEGVSDARGRVTAKAVETVLEGFPSQLETDDIGVVDTKAVRTLAKQLAEPRQEPTSTGVHNITNLPRQNTTSTSTETSSDSTPPPAVGQSGDNGENEHKAPEKTPSPSPNEASNAKEDLATLNSALTCLTAAWNQLDEPVLERALEAHPHEAGSVITAMRQHLVEIAALLDTDSDN